MTVLPIGLVLWAYLHEIVDLGAWGRINPLGGVAARLMDQVETQIYAGQQQIQTMAADPTLADPAAAAEALGRYAPYLQSGRFKALAVDLPGAGRYTLPAALPGAWQGDWPAAGRDGVSELLADPEGGWVVVMAAPLADPNGHLAGVFNISAVLGDALVDRLRVARWGDAFIADGDGRIFLSANPGLTGRSLKDLGLARATGVDGLYTADGWKDDRGERHFVALADSHGYYQGPQNAWKVGLIVPEAIVGERSRGFARGIVAVIVAVLLISTGLAFVLRHSMKGAPR